MFSAEQIDQLLKPIHPSRVLKDAKGMAHVSQQDIRAHLTRIFGFGNWDIEVLDHEMVFEQPHVKNGEAVEGRFDVCYRARVRLTVRGDPHWTCVRYEDVSTGVAQNQNRADGHDLAAKTALSTAIKRCAINLGDQFGLSLYNKGQTSALVKATMVRPEGAGTGDVQDGVPEQLADEAVSDG
ncbi:Rad52/Rad22 family DNA repair protein [Mycobacteroides immunogenum]|uniref:Rad52/Rad22 family DNA repair protein n=1 Tax=Mycobacteroides immunogenum TaxID=83262 RepID=UPI0006BA5A7B|nr:Rad52/Rad22 family DNA repair protein [Mycobacteroides immunogenum]